MRYIRPHATTSRATASRAAVPRATPGGPRRTAPPDVPAQRYACEADVSEGLEVVAAEEIQARLSKTAHITTPALTGLAGVVRFTVDGDLHPLLKLQTVQSICLLEPFAIARPKALLGDEHFRKVLAMIEAARGLYPAGTFKTLHLNAAGSDSSVMTRLKQELSQRTRLSISEGEGDLLIRIRPSPTPSPYQGEGRGEGGSWDVLVRLSPRPLATRAWRACNFEGALNAAVAHAMVRLTQPKSGDTFLNIACGSGTLLIERLSAGAARLVIGCDLDPQALACASQNVTAGAARGAILLQQADARRLPLANGAVTALTADLPFGHLVGSHAENVRTYPLILQEAARVACHRAHFVLITHELRLMEQLLASMSDIWHVEQVLRVELGGLTPRIFVLRRH